MKLLVNSIAYSPQPKVTKKTIKCLSVERVISIPNAKIAFLLDSTHSIRVIVVFKTIFTATKIYLFLVFW